MSIFRKKHTQSYDKMNKKTSTEDKHMHRGAGCRISGYPYW